MDIKPVVIDILDDRQFYHHLVRHVPSGSLKIQPMLPGTENITRVWVHYVTLIIRVRAVVICVWLYAQALKPGSKREVQAFFAALWHRI